MQSHVRRLTRIACAVTRAKQCHLQPSQLHVSARGVPVWLRQASSATTAGDQDVTTSTSTTSNSSNSNDSSRLYSLKQRLKVDPMVQHHAPQAVGDGDAMPMAMSVPDAVGSDASGDLNASVSAPQRFYLETYGCQMNVSDTEIVERILTDAGMTRTSSMDDADVLLANTCAIRDNAEQKVWNRIGHFRKLKRNAAKGRKPVVGVLGCMAERLKSKLVEGPKAVDLVAGPDAYRDLPNLLDIVRGGDKAINVQLSLEETYADVAPVRESGNRTSAFCSIMRGCNNMCAFCIVPFTRGRERSRSVTSIVQEVQQLAEQGFHEVTLLGQNVNSYHDARTASEWDTGYTTSRGFTNMYKLRDGDGVRFAELVDRVTSAVPEMRVRFTSPHPKDFPDDLLHLMRERPNLCNSVHLPAQSGSTEVLKRMRRGYTREAYLELLHRVREMIPGVGISTDIITGFCGETAADHEDTVSLMREASYEQAFMFAYSMRERTHAHRRMQDDVPPEVKSARLSEVIATFREQAALSAQHQIGTTGLLLVEGVSKRSTPEKPELVGRLDNNRRCIVPDVAVESTWRGHDATTSAEGAATTRLQRGDFCVVRVTGAGVTTLQAQPIARTTISEFAKTSA